jgi:predicted Holliday junction resolvase-like endonuclease
MCICPECGEIARLSDLHLRYTGVAPKTWFDTYQSELLALQKKEEFFGEKEDELREESAERGRKKVPKIVKKCLCPEFARLRYDPYDIKAILHPVDFVVFDGMNKSSEVKDVIFLSRKTQNRELNLIWKSIKNTIEDENYDWKVARITIDGKMKLE